MAVLATESRLPDNWKVMLASSVVRVRKSLNVWCWSSKTAKGMLLNASVVNRATTLVDADTNGTSRTAKLLPS